MSTQWYCDLMGKIEGPITAGELLTLVKSGKVTASTLIRKDDSKWFPAEEVGGLFQSAFGTAHAAAKDRDHMDYYDEY